MLVSKEEYWNMVDSKDNNKFDAYCCICSAPWFVTNLRVVFCVISNVPEFVCDNGCTDDNDERFIEIRKELL